MYSEKSRLMGIAVAVTVLLIITPGMTFAHSHGAQDSGCCGSANLPSACTWTAEETQVWGEVRFFDGSDQTFSAGLSTRAGENSEAQFSIFTMDTTTKLDTWDVRSRGTLLGLNFKWLATETEQMRVSVMPGLEYPIERLKSENLDTGAYATSDNLIPVISVPIEWPGEEGTTFRLVPRYVGFDSAPKAYLADGTADGTIDGFGQCVAIGLGVVHAQPSYSLMADAQIVVIGDNATDKTTGAPTRELVWSAGGSWSAPESPVRIDLFATNGFGPTAATSLLATTDNTIGVGLRVSGEF